MDRFEDIAVLGVLLLFGSLSLGVIVLIYWRGRAQRCLFAVSLERARNCDVLVLGSAQQCWDMIDFLTKHASQHCDIYHNGQFWVWRQCW